MEDATIGGLCTSIAEQVLLPDAGAETNSAVSIQRSSDLIIAPATRRALMREVAERAVLLYRLAQRRSGCGVPISPEGSGPHDAAFCVGAAIMELLPALWSSLSRRASLLRPRLPCLRLGSPAPWPIAVREVAKFFARTRHLLGAPTPKPGPPRQELVEAQVECLAVLYFSTVTTAAEQRRHPQLMEVVTRQSSSSTAPGHKRSRPIAESLTVFAADLVEGEEEEDEDDGEASGLHQGAARTMDLRLGEEGVGTAPPTLWTTLATAEQHKEDRCASGTTSSLLPACGSVNWLQLCAEAELAKSLLYWQHLEECLRCPLHFAKLESSPPAAVVFETQPFDHLPTPSRPAFASREAQRRTATVAAPLRWSSTSTEGWRTNAPGDDPTRVQFFHPTHFLREAASAQTRVVDPALFVQTTSAATGVSTMVGSLSSLLPGPTQQITQHYLWWRLLVSGLWMLLYICQGQPTLPDGKAGSCITPQRSSCGDGPATSGGPCGRREGEDYEHLSRTVACCVRVVKEARNYRVGGEEVRCPVCDRLRRDDRQAIYWPALRGDRGALYHQMQPFYGHCAVSSIIAEQRSTNGRAMSPDVDAPDESRQVLSEEEETLRKWWDAFHDKGVGEASNLETAVPLGETRAVLIRILARRLHAAVMLAVAAASSSKAVRRPAPADDAPDPTTSDSASSTVRAPVGVAEEGDAAHNAYGWVAEGRGRGGGSQAPSRRLRLPEIRRLSLRALLERVVLDSRDAAEVARVLLPPSTTPSPEISAQVEKLLDFVPAIPPVREEDAVVECARCYSIFHQGCIAPMQRDMHGGVFLCHTCRLTCPGA